MYHAFRHIPEPLIWDSITPETVKTTDILEGTPLRDRVSSVVQTYGIEGDQVVCTYLS